MRTNELDEDEWTTAAPNTAPIDITKYGVLDKLREQDPTIHSISVDFETDSFREFDWKAA
jgi:hypothetical protein